MEEKLNDQEIVRREKLAKLEELGINPWGERFERTDTSKTCKEKVEGKTEEELENNHIEVIVAGRLMSIRKMGKASFLNIQDIDGRIQGYISIDTVGAESYEVFKMCDIGDIVGLNGRLMRTRTGEVTIRVDKFTFLTKSLKVLPEKFHGLTDVEERYRRRYIDLIMNEEAKRVALLRPRILRSMQHYFDSLGFVEVETSMLQPILGGANAKPFITHHNSLDKDFYLRIATELPLKRLIVGGLEKVYEFGRLFRNEGMDIKHNPEFTTVELYEAYGDLQSMRELCEGVIRHVATEVFGTTTLPYGDKEINFGDEFRWVSMVDLVKEKLGIDFKEDIPFEKAVEFAKSKGIQIEKHWTSNGYILNALFEEFCEEDLIQPTFVYGHPIEISPLTKKGKDPRFTERFELYVNGTEYANAYSELNDPIDQKERFIAQLKAKELGDDEANEMDTDFIEALEYGMPPTGGIGIGFDRLVMLLTNQRSIREVILFPTMKKEK
jgi:lysyl-tRNA synthetase class 2